MSSNAEIGLIGNIRAETRKEDLAKVTSVFKTSKRRKVKKTAF